MVADHAQWNHFRDEIDDKLDLLSDKLSGEYPKDEYGEDVWLFSGGNQNYYMWRFRVEHWKNQTTINEEKKGQILIVNMLEGDPQVDALCLEDHNIDNILYELDVAYGDIILYDTVKCHCEDCQEFYDDEINKLGELHIEEELLENVNSQALQLQNEENVDKHLMPVETIRDITIGCYLPGVISECLCNDWNTFKLPGLNDTDAIVNVIEPVNLHYKLDNVYSELYHELSRSSVVDYCDFQLEISYHIDRQKCSVVISLIQQTDWKFNEKLVRSAFSIDLNYLIKSFDPGSAKQLVQNSCSFKFFSKMARKLYNRIALLASW